MGKDFFPPKPQIPSRVTQKEWIHVYSPDREKKFSEGAGSDDNNSKDDTDSSEEEYSSGKWMLFHDSIELSPSRGLTRHDIAWQFIKRLIESNCGSVSGLFHAKCSTSWMGKRESDPNSSNGVICCYTNYKDIRLTKRAADAIRKAYRYPRDMYYKTDDDTYAMKYRHLGSKYVSLYKHTVENEMYDRDPVTPYYWNIVRV